MLSSRHKQADVIGHEQLASQRHQDGKCKGDVLIACAPQSRNENI